MDVKAAGASIVQVETLGRGGMVVMLVMFIVIVVVGIIAGYSLGVGEARSETLAAQLRTMGARVSVLEYDAARVQAQLTERGLISAPQHD